MNSEDEISSEEKIRALVRQWIEADPLFLDTETTGLLGDAEVCEIAVVDLQGKVLMETLLKPSCTIPEGAMQVHGITNEMVVNAATWMDNIAEELHTLIRDRTVIIYNAEYDLRLLNQTAQAAGVPGFFPSRTVFYCAMQAYAEYWGDWNTWHQSYRWQKLTDAVWRHNLKLPEGIKPHRAAADAELTRQLVLFLAEEKNES